ncbi:MAG: hypothetical protein IKC37_04005 [Clostridia bacterium]|nr:hypothetical protein [Clostridia bacterium]
MESKFEKYVDFLAENAAKRRLRSANVALQKSLRERTDEEVYAAIFSVSAKARQKAAVL